MFLFLPQIELMQRNSMSFRNNVGVPGIDGSGQFRAFREHIVAGSLFRFRQAVKHRGSARSQIALLLSDKDHKTRPPFVGPGGTPANTEIAAGVLRIGRIQPAGRGACIWTVSSEQ